MQRWEISERWRMRDRSTGPWDEVVMQDGQGATLRIRMIHGRRGLWSWNWSMTLLGYPTHLISVSAYRQREAAINSLAETLTRYGFGDLVADLREWENEDGGS